MTAGTDAPPPRKFLSIPQADAGGRCEPPRAARNAPSPTSSPRAPPVPARGPPSRLSAVSFPAAPQLSAGTSWIHSRTVSAGTVTTGLPELPEAAAQDGGMSASASSSPRPASAVFSSAAEAPAALAGGRRLGVLNAVVELNAASGPVRLPEVARRLDLDVRSLSKDVARLTEAGLIGHKDGLLTAELSVLGDLADSVAEHTALCRVLPPAAPLRRFLSHGRLTRLPKRPEDLKAVAAALAELLPEDRCPTETEVNELLGQAGDDVAALRRLLVDLALVERSGSAEYRRRPARSAEATS